MNVRKRRLSPYTKYAQSEIPTYGLTTDPRTDFQYIALLCFFTTQRWYIVSVITCPFFNAFTNTFLYGNGR